MKRFIQMLLAVAIIQILLIVTLTPGRASNFNLGKVEKSGLDVKAQSEYTLSENLAPLNGKYKLRLTDTTIAPGGYMGEHRHVGPGIRLIKSGTLASTHTDKTVVYHTGDHFYEEGSAMHRLQNKTDEPVQILNVELLPVDWHRPSAIPLHPNHQINNHEEES
jgi:quercetin dioxygenase-like cupin family protein